MHCNIELKLENKIQFKVDLFLWGKQKKAKWLSSKYCEEWRENCWWWGLWMLKMIMIIIGKMENEKRIEIATESFTRHTHTHSHHREVDKKWDINISL